MFDLSLAELAFFTLVALFVIDAEDIPKIARTIRSWLDKLAELKYEITDGLDEATRELNLKETLKTIEEEKKRVEEELKSVIKCLPETTSSGEIIKLNQANVKKEENKQLPQEGTGE